MSTEPELLQKSGLTASAENKATLPWMALLALAMTGFVVMMTETLPAGLLPSIAADFSVSQGAAGQLVSFYAIGPVIATIPAMILTRRLPRRPLLMVTLLLFLVANTLTALSNTYELALVARLIAGVCSGVVWGMIAGYARRIVPPALSGRALAVALIGTPVALSFGTPLATFLGSIVGWRWTFGAMSALTLVLLGWIALSLPNAPGSSSASRTPARHVLKIPGILPILAVTFGWMLAHNILYTYIAPFIDATGTGVRTDVALLTFGVSAIAGIWITGIFVDHGLRPLTLGSLTLFAGSMLLLVMSAGNFASLFFVIIIWGFTFGGAPTLLQTAMGDAAGTSGDIAQAILVTGWNLAIFVAGTVGGILLDGLGTASLPPAALLLIALSIIVAIAAKSHAFKPGSRIKNI